MCPTNNSYIFGNTYCVKPGDCMQLSSKTNTVSAIVIGIVNCTLLKNEAMQPFVCERLIWLEVIIFV